MNSQTKINIDILGIKHNFCVHSIGAVNTPWSNHISVVYPPPIEITIFIILYRAKYLMIAAKDKYINGPYTQMKRKPYKSLPVTTLNPKTTNNKMLDKKALYYPNAKNYTVY